MRRPVVRAELIFTSHYDRSRPLFFQPNYLTVRTGDGVKGVWVEPVPSQIVGELKEWAQFAGVQCVRIPGYWISDDKTDHNWQSRRVLYYLHGGGYAAGSAHPSDICSNIPRAIMQHSDAITRAFCLEYRLTKSPRDQDPHPFPAALLDVIAGYIYLVRHVHISPSDIVVAGDSAGANLALALTRYLLENQSRNDVDLPSPPSALILCSPWVDYSGSDIKDGGSPITNRDLDVIETAGTTILRLIDNYVGPHGLHAARSNRYLSPAAQTPEMKSISFHGFPRTLIAVGGFETMRDQSRVLYERMARDLGKAVHYYEMEEAVHDLLIFSWYHEPDRVKLLRAIASWISYESGDKMPF